MKYCISCGVGSSDEARFCAKCGTKHDALPLAENAALHSSSSNLPNENTIRVHCTACSQHIEAPLEMAGTLIDCPSCNARIQLPQPGIAAAPVTNSGRIYYYAAQGVKTGPIPEDRIIQMVQSGLLPVDTLVWTEGLKDWMRAGDIEIFVPKRLVSPSILPPPPPMPDVQHPNSSATPMFLHIPVWRFVVMHIISMGTFGAYWIYKNWQYLKKRDGLKIWPFWRGIFGVFYCYGILKAIRDDKQTNAQESATFGAGMLATWWIIITLGANQAWKDVMRGDLLKSYGQKYSGLTWEGAAFITILPFCFLLPVQKYINRVNAKQHYKPPFSPWSKGQIVCMAAGVILWALHLGLFNNFIRNIADHIRGNS